MKNLIIDKDLEALIWEKPETTTFNIKTSEMAIDMVHVVTCRDLGLEYFHPHSMSTQSRQCRVLNELENVWPLILLDYLFVILLFCREDAGYCISGLEFVQAVRVSSLTEPDLFCLTFTRKTQKLR